MEKIQTKIEEKANELISVAEETDLKLRRQVERIKLFDIVCRKQKRINRLSAFLDLTNKIREKINKTSQDFFELIEKNPKITEYSNFKENQIKSVECIKDILKFYFVYKKLEKNVN